MGTVDVGGAHNLVLYRRLTRCAPSMIHRYTWIRSTCHTTLLLIVIFLMILRTREEVVLPLGCPPSPDPFKRCSCSPSRLLFVSGALSVCLSVSLPLCLPASLSLPLSLSLGSSLTLPPCWRRHPFIGIGRLDSSSLRLHSTPPAPPRPNATMLSGDVRATSFVPPPAAGGAAGAERSPGRPRGGPRGRGGCRRQGPGPAGGGAGFSIRVPAAPRGQRGVSTEKLQFEHCSHLFLGRGGGGDVGNGGILLSEVLRRGLPSSLQQYQYQALRYVTSA